jgi:hypothetical protein
MWLTYTIPDMWLTIPDLCGSPTIPDLWAHLRFTVVTHVPDLCGSPTQFLIYVAHPHDSDLCAHPHDS